MKGLYGTFQGAYTNILGVMAFWIICAVPISPIEKIVTLFSFETYLKSGKQATTFLFCCIIWKRREKTPPHSLNHDLLVSHPEHLIDLDSPALFQNCRLNQEIYCMWWILCQARLMFIMNRRFVCYIVTPALVLSRCYKRSGLRLCGKWSRSNLRAVPKSEFPRL